MLEGVDSPKLTLASLPQKKKNPINLRQYYAKTPDMSRREFPAKGGPFHRMIATDVIPWPRQIT